MHDADSPWKGRMSISLALIAGYAPLGIAAVVATVASRLSTKREPECPVCGPRQQQLATLLERVPDVVLLADAGGTVGYANSAGRAYGIAEGQDLLDCPLVHEDDRTGIRATWNRLLALPGQSVSAEVRIRRSDSWSRLIVTGENLLNDPAVGAVFVTATDAMRRHELDWRLQQAQQLEAVGRLAGGVAHDFNNVLTTIQGLTRLCLEDPALSAETRTDLTEVASAADRAASVTARLLAFSRRQVLRPRVIDLNQHVRDMQRTVRRLIGSDVVINAFTAAREPRVLVDPEQLEQILLNLALNARDAMPRGGLLTLRTDDVTIAPEHAARFPYSVRPGSYVMLEVSDTGPGIPAHMRQQVFEPFFTTKSTEAGSGLGLSTVYGIVKQSGGYVWIDDADGGGARISIHLPVAVEATAPSADVPAERVAGTHPGTVLIAEGDETVRALVRRVLARADYTVLEAADGLRALEICAAYEGRIDLLLTDAMLPGLATGELVDRCRTTRPGMAVLRMAAAGTGAGRRSATDASDVEKPFAPDELIDRVRAEIVARRTPAPATP